MDRAQGGEGTPAELARGGGRNSGKQTQALNCGSGSHTSFFAYFFGHLEVVNHWFSRSPFCV